MDETGARIGCPSGEVVMAPKDAKELYTGSPENRVSILVIETINAAGNYQPPFIILPGQKHLDNWAHPNLEGNVWVATLPTSYISNEAMLEYLDHFMKFSDSGSRKPWSMLLLDGHKCRLSNEFLIKAEKNNRHLQVFPSHETRALQSLDLGIFRQWKHQQNRYINKTLRRHETTYNQELFLKIWNLAHKLQKALRARSRYNGKTRKDNEEMRSQEAKKRKQEEAGLDELELLLETQHIHQRPKTHYDTAMYMKEICTRDSLDPASSPAAHRETLIETHDLLIRTGMQADQIQNLEAAVNADRSRKIASRKGVHKGGGLMLDNGRPKLMREIGETLTKKFVSYKKLSKSLRRKQRRLWSVLVSIIGNPKKNISKI
ncbi:hypothetical protein K3495_g128 [Podosphaera aphanis]|nr:hypothetical protein K3495_g128 [Podosphaera aphanis]